MRRKITTRPALTPRQSERALLSDSTSSSERTSVGKLGGIVRWFRGSKDRCSIDIEAADFPFRKSPLNPRATEGIGRSIQRARRRVERRLGRFGLGKGKKKVSGTEESSNACKFD